MDLPVSVLGEGTRQCDPIASGMLAKDVYSKDSPGVEVIAPFID